MEFNSAFKGLSTRIILLLLHRLSRSYLQSTQPPIKEAPRNLSSEVQRSAC